MRCACVALGMNLRNFIQCLTINTLYFEIRTNTLYFECPDLAAGHHDSKQKLSETTVQNDNISGAVSGMSKIIFI